MIYFCCIGGLLVFNSLVVVFFFNSVLPLLPNSSVHFDITFLEGAGISAFMYVIAFAVGYGMKGEHPLDLIRYRRNRNVSTDDRKQAMRERCSHLTPEQREALKHELVATCGCKETEAPVQETHQRV